MLDCYKSPLKKLRFFHRLVNTCVCGDMRFESDADEGEVKDVDDPDEASVELPSSSDGLFLFPLLIPL